MTWNPDAPLDLLNRASLVYIDLMGHAAYCNWLEQELPRVKIYLNYKTSVIFAASTGASGARDPQPPTAEAGAAAISDDLIDLMVTTLRWYADFRNHDMLSPDSGLRARLALEKYDAERPS